MKNFNFTQCTDFLRNRFSKPLPGPDAHKKLSPPHRIIPDVNSLNDYRTACVMLLIKNIRDKPHLIFIDRADDGHVHSGQISLPGGKTEHFDHDLMQTALRETKEEIGIAENQIDVFGKLSPIYIPPSNFLVHPYAGCIVSETAFNRDEKEVKRILEIPLHDFFSDGAVNLSAQHQTHRGIVTAPCYQLHGVKIWGATCMITSEFLELFE